MKSRDVIMVAGDGFGDVFHSYSPSCASAMLTRKNMDKQMTDDERRE